jgi:hypothetical protein
MLSCKIGIHDWHRENNNLCSACGKLKRRYLAGIVADIMEATGHARSKFKEIKGKETKKCGFDERNRNESPKIEYNCTGKFRVLGNTAKLSILEDCLGKTRLWWEMAGLMANGKHQSPRNIFVNTQIVKTLQVAFPTWSHTEERGEYYDCVEHIFKSPDGIVEVSAFSSEGTLAIGVTNTEVDKTLHTYKRHQEILLAQEHQELTQIRVRATDNPLSAYNEILYLIQTNAIEESQQAQIQKEYEVYLGMVGSRPNDKPLVKINTGDLNDLGFYTTQIGKSLASAAKQAGFQGFTVEVKSEAPNKIQIGSHMIGEYSSAWNSSRYIRPMIVWQTRNQVFVMLFASNT